MTHLDITAYLDPAIRDAELAKAQTYVKTGLPHKSARTVPWAILSWLAALANEDLVGMDPAMLAKRQDTFRACQAIEMDGMMYGGPPPDRDQLIEFQTTVRGHFTELTDRGKLDLGPFRIRQSFEVPLNRPKPHGELQRGYPLYSGEVFVDSADPPVLGEMLLYRMGKCLQQCADLVKRCELCRGFFLQARRVRAASRTQKYCCAYHRSWAAKKRAAEARAAQRQAAAQRQTAKRGSKQRAEQAELSSQKKKGAKKHGQKRR